MKAYREEVAFVEDDVVMTDYITKTRQFLDKFDIEF